MNVHRYLKNGLKKNFLKAFYSSTLFTVLSHQNMYPLKIVVPLPMRLIYISSLATILFLISCTHTPVKKANPTINPTTNPVTTNPCDPDSVYFQNSILPALISNCAMSGCHSSASHADGIVLDNYTSIIQTGEIEAGKPNKSELFKAITESDPDKRMPPPPAAALSPELIEQFRVWILQGAKNNACQSCDTNKLISFSQDVQPIIQTACLGCHQGSGASADIDLSSYAGVKAVADDGKLNGSILHLNGFSPMPKNGNQLDICDRTKIIHWIQAGSLNN